MPLRPLAVALLLASCGHPRAPRSLQPEPPPPAEAAPARTHVAPASPPSVQSVDFTRDIRPVLESRCQPCHFTGGRMYDRLPFDKPETIRQLGERLFTRIKAANEQAVIRQFLAQGQ